MNEPTKEIQKKVIDMDNMPLRWGHIRVFIASFPGQLLGSGLATLIGIVMPLLQLSKQTNLTSIEQGVISCLILIGIMIGASIIGSLSDKYGYLKFFRINPIILLIASLLIFLFQNIWVLSTCSLMLGLAIGGEYSLGSDYISQIMPRKYKALFDGIAKTTSAIGSIIFALIAFIVLKHVESQIIWNKLYLVSAIIALIMFLLRIPFRESPGWLIDHNKHAEAEASVKYFLGNDVTLKEINTDGNNMKNISKPSLKQLFTKKNINKVMFSGLPWFCEGFGVYGIGIFLPILVMTLGLEKNSVSHIHNIINSVEMTIYINIFVLVGFIVGLLVVNKISHINLQGYGFVICSFGILLLLLSHNFNWPLWVNILGFLIFEIFLNAGPHLTTFIIPSEIYPIEERGMGVGMATSIGKAGAILGVFFIPNLLRWGGIDLVLITAIVINLIGAGITWSLGRKAMTNIPQ